MIPKTRIQRVVELKETLWIPLKRNSWSYVAAVPSQMTIFCPNQSRAELEVKNNGILSFPTDCTGYSDRVIRPVTSHYVNQTHKDIIPPLDFILDCFESEAAKINLNELQLGTLLKNLPTHNDELQLASYIIKDDKN
jgi:hypothetical protein